MRESSLPQEPAGRGLWLPELAQEIAEATAFVLLVGEKSIGPWQAMEYYEALDRPTPRVTGLAYLVKIAGVVEI
jgi:hypothetical protein